ncbi:amino acid ABC transporter permease [Verrucosispora sioxanthis]|uniref:Amino acid ABC transporter permease n=1 Tax=Verrucosispora sioxanthis TaxID=2499994 RepID=A0A6M1L6W9_9ACTN|nr:amino acid ABC transporter permease [Verrucosispora sioxanthis]NEE62643.1 amino acid ABC transporter permease [Verrucosispora sioxanthis]NGM11753.1 amino acid ABC transporter permease [Verrucosispora sioxanthis]
MSNDSMSVLYDAPGPRARRITLISSILAALAAVAGLYFLVYRPLDERGQFSMERWGPLIDPGNEVFGQVWTQLGQGFRATLTAAALAIVSSLAFGTLLAVLRVQLKSLMRRRFDSLPAPVALAVRALSWLLNGVTRFFVEVFRGLPVVITIFFCASGLPVLGVDLGDILWYLVLGLTIYNGVVIGEILRSGMEGLPGGQREAADAIGLTSFQATRMILLPQAFRIMLPALISQLVVVLKDTSLGFIISYEEVLRKSSFIIQVLDNPIQVYVVVGVIYIAVNYLLSKLAEYAQRRLAKGRRTARKSKPATTGGESTTVQETEAVAGTAT